MNGITLTDWMPIRIFWERGQPLVDWCYLGQGRFEEPFFEDTIKKCFRQPFSVVFRHKTPLAALSEVQASEPGLAPTGFIFHMSRCGSTLVSQMLAALPQNIVISEAGPIDTLVRANQHDARMSDEQRIVWLRALLSVYARPRHGERHFFVKFDSWHTLALPLIQRAFPDVPWIFVIRDPVQVLVSHSRQPGAQMVPSLLPPAWLGLDWPLLAETSPSTYWAQVLGRICEAALEHMNEQARVVNYRDLTAAVWSMIAPHFGLAYTAAENDRIDQAARFDAKNPSLFFVEDTTGKINAATDDIRQAAERWLLPVYTALEARRREDMEVMNNARPLNQGPVR